MLTPDEVRAMTPDEIRERYDEVQAAMAAWPLPEPSPPVRVPIHVPTKMPLDGLEGKVVLRAWQESLAGDYLGMLVVEFEDGSELVAQGEMLNDGDVAVDARLWSAEEKLRVTLAEIDASHRRQAERERRANLTVSGGGSEYSEKRRAKRERDIAVLETKLRTEGFIAKAPQEVIDATRERLDALLAEQEAAA